MMRIAGNMILCIVLPLSAAGQWKEAGRSYFFDRHYGQVEVGGRYVGAEFHRSRPLPSRLSFYYPVANSIDLSTDYWRRDESLPVAIGIAINGGKRKWIGREGWSYTVSPHRVRFENRDSLLQTSICYEFCLNEPAMVMTIAFMNISNKPLELVAYAHVRPALRTCQTYARKDSAQTLFDNNLQMVAAKFSDSDADRVAVFVVNGGEKPVSWTSDGGELAVTDSGTSNWTGSTHPLSRRLLTGNGGIPLAAFEFRKRIDAGDSLVVIQIVGSCREAELIEVANRLSASSKSEVMAYDELVRLKSEQSTIFRTGDQVLDASAVWAKGILAANAHYLDGKIVPMPCPAEYNFFFTHDLLMTDLAVVNFDLERVKSDLLYVASHSRDSVIPHAYYWRDDGFKTEYCTPDNWNHFWFVMLTASYLRHSHDDSTVRELLPLVTKSLEEVRRQVKSDHLAYAYRPDWWDIGHIEGPRAYTTTLAIRTLREFLFIGSFLGLQAGKLREYESLADSMQNALELRLWDDRMKYLTNYNEGKKDEHYYMGSLLAPAFGLLELARAKGLVETASKVLLDAKIGIRNAMPPDFHTREAINFYKFAGDEAGKP
ncbi:MAG TPA: hypothetical protein VGR15_08665, partial [Bacteroidota bacterium]|nr:hypothetical protein [Bacteroidota bacterium]